MILTLVVAVLLCEPARRPDIDTLVKAGLPRERVVQPFAVTAAVQKAADDLVTKGSRDDALSTRARAIYDGLRALIGAGAIIADRDNRPKARDPWTADQLWAAVARNDKPVASCYDLTVLFIAMARSQGINAVGAEPVNFIGTGETGHVLAVVMDAKGGRTRVDLQNGSIMRDYGTLVINDFQLTAHYYNQHAVAAMVRKEVEIFERDLRDGLVIDDTVAELHANHAIAEISMGHPSAAVLSAKRAAELKPNNPFFHYTAGLITLRAGHLCPGLAHVQRALHILPSYPEARDLARSTLEAHPELHCP
ncbi:MAG: hypothetical protein H7Z43_02905 [Clostridia bacterium]|nr:hypothetical protein [Deltaproteobacteria bacterium]